MSKAPVGLFYGSSTCYTEIVADKIRDILSDEVVDVYNITDESLITAESYAYLIMGIPTWDYGELQEDWEEIWDELDLVNFSGRKVALYGLGDQVVVGGGAAAVQRRQPAFVLVELQQEIRVALEEIGGAGPAVEQAPGPGERDQPHAELDPAQPVDAAQRRVAAPPRTQVCGGVRGEARIAGEPPGRREQRHMMQSRRFPDIFHHPHPLRIAIGNGEAILCRVRADAGADVPMPIGIGRRGVEVMAQYGPSPGQDLFRREQEPLLRFRVRFHGR